MVVTQDGKIRHYISFGGVSTADYENCYCDGSESFGAAERDIEKVSIPGRNGDLTFDKGRYKDQSYKYTIFFYHIEDFKDFKNRISALRGVQRLDDSHHPNEYRLATLSGDINPTVTGYDNCYASVELNLTLYPQRFLTSGTEAKTYTSGTYILHNPTMQDALPLIQATNTGTFKVDGDVKLQVGSLAGYSSIHVDSEIQDAYYISGTEHVNANGNITVPDSGFPVLHPGDNTINIIGMGTVTITPRWWCV